MADLGLPRLGGGQPKRLTHQSIILAISPKLHDNFKKIDRVGSRRALRTPMYSLFSIEKIIMCKRFFFCFCFCFFFLDVYFSTSKFSANLTYDVVFCCFFFSPALPGGPRSGITWNYLEFTCNLPVITPFSPGVLDPLFG